MNEKTRKIINRLCAVVAVISAIVTVLLLPPVKDFLKGDEPSDTVINTTSEAATTQAEIPSDYSEETAENTAPSHTTALMNPNKNYTLFVDVRYFDYTEENGVTKIVAKDNKSVAMVITPFKDKPYSELCDETINFYHPLDDSEKLKITSDNSAYRSQSGDMDDDVITTVYCVDDSRGGSVQIVQQIPVNADSYENSFRIFLSMFKIL